MEGFEDLKFSLCRIILRFFSSCRKFTLLLDYYSFSTNRIAIDDSRFLTINQSKRINYEIF